MVSNSECVQKLRQCEKIKNDIHGKSFEVANALSEEFAQRQNLENLYKSVLLDDVQYALDNKVELDLWNRVFKEHIDNFRLKIKEKKMNNEKNDIQAKLSVFLDVSTGFYFQLLQEFCDAYELDLPYHGKASQLGILSKRKKAEEMKPKLNACLYVCQDCLVHLGDLARYRNDLQQAETYYTLASKVLPGNGQPYNQLAILASAKGNNLQAVFYYFKSISVPNPFPAASSNLQKTLCQMCAKHNYAFMKTNGTSVAEFLELFLNFTGSVYLMQDGSKLNALKDCLLQDIKEVLSECSQLQILHMMAISVFNLQKLKYNHLDVETDDDGSTWHIMLLFCVQFLQVLLDYSIDMMRNQSPIVHMKALPAIKMFADWIVCCGTNILTQEAFQETSRLYYQIVTFGNELLEMSIKREKSVLPLMEDWEMHGVTPFRKIHRRYDYRIQPVEVTVIQVWNIRVSRIFHFIDWLCQQEHMTQFLTKVEQNGKSEYICKELPTEFKASEKDTDIIDNTTRKQLLTSSSAHSNDFFPKTRSLFRTESEEGAMHMIQNVSNSIPSYSLFENLWNSSLQSISPAEDALSTGSTGISSMANTTIFPRSNSEQQTDIYNMKNNQHRPLHTPTYDIQIPNLTNAQTRQSPEFQETVNQIADRIQLLPLQTQSINASPSQSIPTRSYRSGVWFNQLQPQIQHAHIIESQSKQRAGFVGNVPLHQHQQLKPLVPQENSIPLPANLSRTTIPQQGFFSQQSPNYGVIGQTMRPAAPIQPPSGSQIMAPNFSTIPLPQRHWGTPQAIQPDPSNEARRNIWTSNFGIGQSQISPLEQLIKDQRRHQHPR